MTSREQLVSIIVPVYNAGAYIEETIASVRAQSYPHWELILVDDCSTDDSRERIRCCMERAEKKQCVPAADTGDKSQSGVIRLIEKPVNEGAAMARNTGIEAAQGRYLAFLDGDDLWMPDKLSRELAFMKEKQAAFTFTAYEFGDEKARGTGKIVHVPQVLTYKQALSRTVIFTTTVLFDLDHLSKEQIRMPLVKSEDTAAWWRILRTGINAYGLDEVLAIYRRPAKSLSSNKLEAVRRIWNLYRREEKLPLLPSCYYLFFWALRATLRRL